MRIRINPLELQTLWECEKRTKREEKIVGEG